MSTDLILLASFPRRGQNALTSAEICVILLDHQKNIDRVLIKLMLGTFEHFGWESSPLHQSLATLTSMENDFEIGVQFNFPQLDDTHQGGNFASNPPTVQYLEEDADQILGG